VWIFESMAPQRHRCIVTAKQTAVKKYVVKLNDAEREQLNALIHAGKRRAGQLVKAKAGEGWSDSETAAALSPWLPGPVSNWWNHHTDSRNSLNRQPPVPPRLIRQGGAELDRTACLPCGLPTGVN
jgi:hypothetical protein